IPIYRGRKRNRLTMNTMNNFARGHLTLLFVAVGLSGPPARAADPLAYNRDIRPILAANCFACHGPDSAARKAKLRLDRREEAVKSEAIVPGNPDKSELIRRVFADKPDQVMPPPKTHKKLSSTQKDMLRRWIAVGAEYQPHWSFIPPQRPPLPVV